MNKKELEEIQEGTVISVNGTKNTLIKIIGYLGGDYSKKQHYLFDGIKTAYIDVENYKVVTDELMLYKPVQVRYGKEFDFGCIDIDRNFTQLKETDQKQKSKNTILYRYLKFPYADGFAVYQIVEVKRNKVRLLHCTGLGDDWEIPEILNGGYLDRDMAERNISNRDMRSEFASGKSRK